MQIQYISDGEQQLVTTLDELVANFNENEAWHYRANEEDMRRELASRGWYDGLHECGHYLVLNLELLGLKPVQRNSAGLRKVKWSFDWPDKTYVGWTDESRWNGFLNVAVLPSTRDEIVADCEDAGVTGDDTPEQIAALPIEGGLVWLRNGWAISEVQDA